MMRTSLLFALLVAVPGCASQTAARPQVAHLADKRAAIDEPVPDFRLRDLTRDEPAFVSLSQSRGRVVVLYFLSHQCRTSWLYEERIGTLLADFRGKSVTFLGVRSSSQDTDDATRKYVEAKNLDMPVLADEGNVLADYFRIPQTPVFVVIDPQGRMRYWGALDDHANEKKAQKPYLRSAIDALLAGRTVTTKRGVGLG